MLPGEKWRPLLIAAAWLFAFAPAATGVPAPTAGSASVPTALPPIRFLLTFDDGPVGWEQDNPTERILDTLEGNGVQPGIKAIFFVQTRSSEGGATERGRALMRRECREGHLVALHDGSPWGHRSHRHLSDDQLDRSLRDGVDDITVMLGRRASLIRPPYWSYDGRTLSFYERHGLAVLLTDVTANDGKDWGFKASLRRHTHMVRELEKVRQWLDAGKLPVVEGVAPVVVTFHDTNEYTAAHMHEYLQLLVDAAHQQGMAVSERPFYDGQEALERVALLRARDTMQREQMVPWWWRLVRWLEMV